MLTNYIITLDGPAGVGKSVLSKRIAQTLGISFLDTGAMFRATAVVLFQAFGKKARIVPEAELMPYLRDIRFALFGTGKNTRLFINDQPVGQEIRSEEIAMTASQIATLPTVRETLKAAQQKLGNEVALVAEGRDMGTAVFPHALHKLFLDAPPNIRACRRYEELRKHDSTANYENIYAAILTRDEQDRNRQTAPLRQPADAYYIDTGPLTLDQVYAAAMGYIHRK